MLHHSAHVAVSSCALPWTGCLQNSMLQTSGTSAILLFGNNDWAAQLPRKCSPCNKPVSARRPRKRWGSRLPERQKRSQEGKTKGLRKFQRLSLIAPSPTAPSLYLAFWNRECEVFAPPHIDPHALYEDGCELLSGFDSLDRTNHRSLWEARNVCASL